MSDRIRKIIEWLKAVLGIAKPKPQLEKAFNAYNESAKKNQTKPMNETRKYLFAVLESLVVVPSKLANLNWDIVGDRTQATNRFRACVEAVNNGEKWVVQIPVPLFCESRSANPRWENSLREAVRSYYSLGINKGFNFVIVPDKVNPESAFVVRIS